jgi:4-aminobutyrate aminotransferase/(S)-3-amino-2-methylpropionate transaminase
VLRRVREQVEKLQHACFMVAPYEPYVELARKLCEIVPIAAPKKAALFNSGAEAVENAVKIARRATGRPAVLAFDPGFHGRTLLALSLTSKTTPYRDGFGPFAPEIYRFPVPDMLRRPAGVSAEDWVARGIDDFHRFFKSSVNPASIACAVIEPVFGEGGFIVPPRELLEELAAACKAHGIVLVFDEVQTGFGRTGRMFASERLGIEPDLVCLAKSLSNGFPLAAVVGRAAIMDATHAGGLGGTFGGNPAACAAALGAIETLECEDLPARAEAIGAVVAKSFETSVERFPFVAEGRGVGAMRALELVKDRASLEPDAARTERVLALAASRGLLLLSAGLHSNVIRTLMPLVVTDAELEEGLAVLESCLRDVR